MFPYSILDCIWLAPFALCLDLVAGDPRLPWPHPVCIIGSFLNFQERIWRRLVGGNPWLERGAGIASVAITGGAASLSVWGLCSLPLLGPIFAIYLAWAGLAMGCLLKTGGQVIAAIEKDSLAEGRQQVSMLVSRDVSGMTKPELRKTLADTLSENFTDAFTAPFFWLLVAGPTGLWFYKAVSTMDSQWGYKTPVWKNLGLACARCDDALAWLPARISAFCLFIVDAIIKALHLRRPWQGDWPGFRTIRRDAAGMTSPNSGWSMAACAWLCNGKMAGPSLYFGEMVHKEWLGPPDRPAWSGSKLETLRRLMLVGSAGTGILLWLCGFGLVLFLRAGAY